ncbi:MAG: hypothetical protein MJ067_05535 [Oscillospiraceae bacterium]|nr:hypothetical protein [Oscillospiraceae bacterium]
MYELKPISPRVQRVRERYRTTVPPVCIERYRLVTEFYMANKELISVLKRAYNFKNLCEKMPISIDDDDVIVGGQSPKFMGGCLYPENNVSWLKEEAKSGLISTRPLDPYTMSEEDKEYYLSTADFWDTEHMGAKCRNYMPESYKKHTANLVTLVGFANSGAGPVGHFCANYNKAIRVGFGAIRAEAAEKLREYEEQGLPGNTIDPYNFYRSIVIVCDGMITLTKRYAALAAEKAEGESNPERKAELLMMADGLNNCMEKPARSFYEAVQALFMYQTCLCLDANMHGISFGRVDQYLGDFYDADMAAGTITDEYAQELLDLFYLKVAQMNRPWDAMGTEASPGYTSGQLMTLGGVKKDGTDATNAVTYMMLQTSGRLVLHSPPQSLRVHKNTPEALWEAAIETTKIAGGVPSFENDEVIIPALMKRGLSLESARNYCPIGCVEPGGCGDEWPACGGDGGACYFNLVAALLLAINDGHYPLPMFGNKNIWDENTEGDETGPATGYLYNMTSFEQVLDAFRTQIEFFVRWHVVHMNMFEYIARDYLPQPVVSATMEGCMESGKDVMWGGAKYNSTGIAGVGIGNVADSLFMIKHLVFDTKKCTARELYDALKNNWKGYEELQGYVKRDAPHYGNGIEEVDKWAHWTAKVFSDAVNSKTGPRGRYSAGLYPITTNILYGRLSPATPDGRNAGDPLADGISPVQQMDKNGPTATLKSVSSIDQLEYPNGTLLNMKFHPSSMKNSDSIAKLSGLIGTYFDMGGMEVQINVINADIMRKAQEHPENYQNLVVRVAGFSTYFVELHKASQDDIISRTELSVG